MMSLRQRMTEDMQVRNFSPHTQASYLQQIAQFARYFHKQRICSAPRRFTITRSSS